MPSRVNYSRTLHSIAAAQSGRERIMRDIIGIRLYVSRVGGGEGGGVRSLSEESVEKSYHTQVSLCERDDFRKTFEIELKHKFSLGA